MPPPLSLLLLLLSDYPHFSSSSISSLHLAGARWRPSQQLPDFLGGAAHVAGAQVLPRLLPRVVPLVHVSLELPHQQAQHVLVAVHGSQVQGGVAAGRPDVHVQGHAGFLHAVPEGARTRSRTGLGNQETLYDVLDKESAPSLQVPLIPVTSSTAQELPNVCYE